MNEAIPIELIEVSKRFGTRQAVDNLSLQVPSGEIFGLLGHNGAGKSTAIGMMLGQVWATRGTIRLWGCDILEARQKALERVGAIFETPVFYDYLSGWRNLQILSQYTGPIQPKRIQEIVDWVGLTGRDQAAVRTYSHGMRARLALAQALLPDPRLLILDEPSDGLDPEGIHEMRLTILRLHRELGLTILLSSHLLNEVEQLCTRIAVMSHGRKVFEGAIQETRQARNWVRVRTQRFSEAANQLRQAGLIEKDRGDEFILPSPGVETERIVEFMVEHKMPVYEIAPEEQSLEAFYLSLMKNTGGA
jgi:ABC-2 type transport system ATP-binding protein